jgi:hypothetical protein
MITSVSLGLDVLFMVCQLDFAGLRRRISYISRSKESDILLLVGFDLDKLSVR